MPAPVVEDAFFFLLCNFDFSVENQELIGGRFTGLGLRFDSNNSSVFMQISDCFHYYISVVELEITDGDTSGISFIEQNCFSYPEFCFVSFFYMKLNTVLSRSVRIVLEF